MAEAAGAADAPYKIGKGPALDWLELERLIADVAAAGKLFAFVYDNTIRENARVDPAGRRSVISIALDEREHAALIESEFLIGMRITALVDAFYRAHRINDRRKPIAPVGERT